MKATMKSGRAGSVSGKSKGSASTAGETTQGGPKGGAKEAKNNDWIPT